MEIKIIYTDHVVKLKECFRMYKTINAANFSTKSIKIKLIIFAGLVLAISIGLAGFFNVRSSQMALAEKIEEASFVNTSAQSEITHSNVIESGRKIVSVPRISWVKAGAFERSNYTDETSGPDYYVETTVRVSSRAFALTVDNDSMIDLDGGPYSFPEGSDIICDPDKECTVGSFVIAKDTRTQKTTFKKLTSDGLHLYLSPLNKRYNPIPIDNEHIRLIAKVIDTSIKLP